MRHRVAGMALLVSAALLAGCSQLYPPGLYPSASPTDTSSPSASPSPPAPSPSPSAVTGVVTHDFGVPVAGAAFRTEHTVVPPVAPPPAPPLPCLVEITSSQHPDQNPPYEEFAFRFSGAFPTYEIVYGAPTKEGTGNPVELPGTKAVLTAKFEQAQAHQDANTCIQSEPGSPVNLPVVHSYVQAGDNEGVVTYGIGIGEGSDADDGQGSLRVVESQVEDAAGTGYVVALQFKTASGS
jgi:hypothetical protein